MITMVRNGKRVKITKKQFRNYCLHLKLRSQIKQEQKKDKAKGQ